MSVNKIPKQLQDFTFVKLGKQSKRPLGKTWETCNYEEAQKHDGNIAIIPEDKAIVIDCDEKELEQIIEKNFPNTFIVKTGKGFHVYYKCKNFKNKKVLCDKDRHLGEIITGHNFVVCPPSIHPNGHQYRANDKPMKSLTKKQVDDVLSDFYKRFGKDNKINFNKGATKGTRDNTLFQYACELRNKKLEYSEALELCLKFNEKCKPPLSKAQVEKCVISSYKGFDEEKVKKGMEDFTEKEAEKEKEVNALDAPRNLKELYKRIDKWLYITDWNMVDLILGIALSGQAKNTKPLWVFLVGNSGDGKSELTTALYGFKDTILLDRISANTLASGMVTKGKKANDLGMTLQHSSHIIIFSDLACLKSININEKNEIWGQLRELYDERINKRTGAKGAEQIEYNGCHVTMIACSTPDIKSEYTVYNQLGTREFSYDIKYTPEDDEKKMAKALEHHEKEFEMKEDLRNAIQGFLMLRSLKHDIKWNDSLQKWVMRKCKELSLFRASVQFEKQTGELRSVVEKEVPTRLIQQFSLLYKSLKSLEEDYPDEKYKTIVNNIVKSSGDPIRQRVYEFFIKRANGEKFHINGLHERLHIGRKTIKKQCEVLTFMGYLERTVELEYYGASKQFERDVTYYRFKTEKERNEKEYGQGTLHGLE